MENSMAGKWSQMSFNGQLGNIGSEVDRAFHWCGKDAQRFQGAVERANELFDLSLKDTRWTGKQREVITRLSGLFRSASSGDAEGFTDIIKELYPYAVAARRD